MNDWGRCHDVKNLFIVDGSVFVTAGGGEPDQHDPGARALRRRPDQEEPLEPLRLSRAGSADAARTRAEPRCETRTMRRRAGGAARTLAAVLDEIVPPSDDGRLPGAGALGLADGRRCGARRTPELARRVGGRPRARSTRAGAGPRRRGVRGARRRAARGAPARARRARAGLPAGPRLPHLRRLLPAPARARGPRPRAAPALSRRATRSRRATSTRCSHPCAGASRSTVAECAGQGDRGGRCPRLRRAT